MYLYYCKNQSDEAKDRRHWSWASWCLGSSCNKRRGSPRGLSACEHRQLLRWRPAAGPPSPPSPRPCPRPPRAWSMTAPALSHSHTRSRPISREPYCCRRRGSDDHGAHWECPRHASIALDVGMVMRRMQAGDWTLDRAESFLIT